jgi:hypothetical protein
VLVRPEQIVLSDATAGGPAGGPAGGVEGTVESYEYFGHDAVVRVRPGSADLPELVVRVTGGRPVEPGRRVGLSVQGGVVAWPRARGEEGEADGVGGRVDVTENSRTTPP